MNKEKLDIFKQGFVQLGISAFIYILWVILGFISVITIGYILEGTIVVMWVQGAIALLSNITGIYLSYKFLQE
jgi:hypothetical protein